MASFASVPTTGGVAPWEAGSEKACQGTRWSKPNGFPTGIFVRNSLCSEPGNTTSDLVELVTMEKNHLKFYICGPTVYALSHLGHARAYLTFDIVRRVLEDFFGLDTTVVMNITDVDDKIIKRGRENYLWDRFAQAHPTPTADGLAVLRAGADHATAKAAKKLEGTADPAEQALFGKNVAEAQGIQERVAALAAGGDPAPYVALCADPLVKSAVAEYLDATQGSTVNDNTVFDVLPKHFEKAYFEDMENLGVRPPTVITRVSEYVPEIVSMCEKIIANGYGYESNGSVYFDTEAFKKSGHVYRKLVPPAETDTAESERALLREGEGALSDLNAAASEKRNEFDFALWKNAKPGEPTWDSPWGKGRPGWHIECSAMGLSVFGEGNMDMHAGGIDLRFPHHDNELAQNEACFCNHQSVNYFLHAGHLHIDGLKMSKSLKNFTTIRAALEETCTASQIRMLFLLNAWDKPMNFSNSQFDQAVAIEKRFTDFFQNIKVSLRGQSAGAPKRWRPDGEAELALWAALDQTRQSVRAALENNINTNDAINHLLTLISAVNNYLRSMGAGAQGYLLLQAAQYIMKVLQCFGLTDGGFDSWLVSEGAGLRMAGGLGAGLGKSIGAQGGADGDAGVGKEEMVTPFLQVLAGFRDKVRAAASSGADKSSLFQMCHEARTELLRLGVRLEDRSGESTAWKFGDANAMQHEEATKKATEAAAKAKKEAAKAKKAAEAAAKAKAAAVPPSEMFRSLEVPGEPGVNMYSQFDDAGMPTHDAKGEPLAKSQLKKLTKQFNAQKKAHDKHVAALAQKK